MYRSAEITEHLVWEQKNSSESQKYWSIRQSARGVLIQNNGSVFRYLQLQFTSSDTDRIPTDPFRGIGHNQER